jgi:tellurium resistance protein TerD
LIVASVISLLHNKCKQQSDWKNLIMGVALKKGANLSLSNSDVVLKKTLIGLGWNTRAKEGSDFDLDASVFMLNEHGEVRGHNDFIFYGNLESKCKSLHHVGDNRSGAAASDLEAVFVELEKVPDDIHRLAITVTTHDADVRKQNFGQIEDAFIRIVSEDDDQEFARFDLAEVYSTETAMIFGEVYRYGSDWKFKAVGQGFSGGLEAMCKTFGVRV